MNLFIMLLIFFFGWRPLPPWAGHMLVVSLPFVLMSTSLALAFHAVRCSEQRAPGRAYSIASLCISNALFAVYLAFWLYHGRSA
jgi:hypothetical protein